MAYQRHYIIGRTTSVVRQLETGPSGSHVRYPTSAWRGEVDTARQHVPAESAQPRRRRHFRRPRPPCRDHHVLLLGGIIVAWSSLPCRRSSSSVSLPVDRRLGSTHQAIRRPGAHLRHDRHFDHCTHHRGACQLRHRAFPDRTRARVAAPSARYRHRTARRDSVDRVRHVGLLVFAPIFAAVVRKTARHGARRHPFVGALFQGPPIGIGILCAGVILAIMIIPYIAR